MKLPSAHICKPCTGNQFCIRKLVSRISRKSNIKELAGFFLRVPWEVNGGKCKEMF